MYNQATGREQRAGSCGNSARAERRVQRPRNSALGAPALDVVDHDDMASGIGRSAGILDTTGEEKQSMQPG